MIAALEEKNFLFVLVGSSVDVIRRVGFLIKKISDNEKTWSEVMGRYSSNSQIAVCLYLFFFQKCERTATVRRMDTNGWKWIFRPQWANGCQPLLRKCGTKPKTGGNFKGGSDPQSANSFLKLGSVNVPSLRTSLQQIVTPPPPVVDPLSGFSGQWTEAQWVN